jgi:hypothetical protein
MSVLSYLESRASGAILSSNEETSINTSIVTLKSRLTSHFGTNLAEQFRFGSSTRGTILPRSMDDHSDIDYMVVFADAGYAPQTYLDRVKAFAEKYYGSSTIKQSSPTIVLELNHIKFDLVPALKSGSGYKVIGGYGGWQDTNPNDFNTLLTDKNNRELYKIKPTIRLAKFWNAQSGYVYESFGFEKWMISQSFTLCLNQKDYLFNVFDNLNPYGESTQWRKDKIQRAKDIIAEVKGLEAGGYPALAEAEVKKLIPA